MLARDLANEVECVFVSRYLDELEVERAMRTPTSSGWFGWRPSPGTRNFMMLVVSCIIEAAACLATPKTLKVLCFDDNVTPMEFVVSLLEQVFHLSHEDAVALMLSVHRDGTAVAASIRPLGPAN